MDASQLGITLFSLTNEWQTGSYTLETLLERTSATGLGPGIEVVGGQSFRDFPAVDAGDVRSFRGTVERLGLVPTALGVFADYGRRADRMLTTDEVVADLVSQFDAAVALGFPVVRPGLGMDRDVIERVTPELESRGLVMAMELQGPIAPDAPLLTDTLDLFESIDSPSLGLTLDFSLFMPDLPTSLVGYLEGRGVGSAIIDVLSDALQGRNEGVPALARAAAAEGLGDELFMRCAAWLHRFGHHRPETWSHVLPWVRHAHAKFWDLEAPERDIVPIHGAFLQMLDGVGYHGAVASEWGGNDWLELEDANAFILSAEHLALLRRLIA